MPVTVSAGATDLPRRFSPRASQLHHAVAADQEALLPTVLHPSLLRAVTAGARFARGAGSDSTATQGAGFGSGGGGGGDDDSRSVNTADGSVGTGGGLGGGGGDWETSPRLGLGADVGAGAWEPVYVPAMDAVEWATSSAASLTSPGTDGAARSSSAPSESDCSAAIVEPPIDGVRIVRLAAGEAHVVACSRDGLVWSWGLNSHRQVGIGGAIVETPCQVSVHPRLAAHDAAERDTSPSVGAGASQDAEHSHNGQGGGVSAAAAALQWERERLFAPSSVRGSRRRSLQGSHDADSSRGGGDDASQRGQVETSSCTINGTLPYDSDPVVAVYAGAFHSVVGTASGAMLAWGRNAEGALGLTSSAPSVQRTPDVLRAPASSRRHFLSRSLHASATATGGRTSHHDVGLPSPSPSPSPPRRLFSSHLGVGLGRIDEDHPVGAPDAEEGSIFVGRPWRRVLDVAAGKDFTLILEADFPPSQGGGEAAAHKRQLRRRGDDASGQAPMASPGSLLSLSEGQICSPVSELRDVALAPGGTESISVRPFPSVSTDTPKPSSADLSLVSGPSAGVSVDRADSEPVNAARPTMRVESNVDVADAANVALTVRSVSLVSSAPLSSDVGESGRFSIRGMVAGTNEAAVAPPRKTRSSGRFSYGLPRSSQQSAATAAADERAKASSAAVLQRSQKLRAELLRVATAASKQCRARATAEHQAQAALDWWRNALIHVHGSFDAYTEHNVDVQVPYGCICMTLMSSLTRCATCRLSPLSPPLSPAPCAVRGNGARAFPRRFEEPCGP
jgi:hypothetical protein